MNRFSLASPGSLALFTAVGMAQVVMVAASCCTRSSAGPRTGKGRTMRPEGAPVAVVGAGLAGLTAAAALAREGVPVRVFEAGPKIAGLSASYSDADGFSYDFGAHFITNRLAATLGVGALCRDVQRYGEAVFLDGRWYGYPLGLALSRRFAPGAAKARARALLRGDAAVTAEEWFRRSYGDAFAEAVALPLLEAWSGAPAGELAASVADKLGGSFAAQARPGGGEQAAGEGRRERLLRGPARERPRLARLPDGRGRLAVPEAGRRAGAVHRGEQPGRAHPRRRGARGGTARQWPATWRPRPW